MPEPSKANVCPVCGEDFSRQDHLKRHLHAHDPTQVYPCRHCGKEFTRRDSLLRHERGHEENTTAEGHRTIFTRASRACTNCSRAKVRCDGESPCRYCASRNLSCTQNVHQRKRPRTHSSLPEPEVRDPTRSPSCSNVQPPRNTNEAQACVTLPTPISADHSALSDTESVVRPQIGLPGGEPSLADLGARPRYQDPPTTSAIPFLSLQEWGPQYSITDWMGWETDDFLPSANPQVSGLTTSGTLESVDYSATLGTHPFPGTSNVGSRPNEPSVLWPAYYQNRANEVLASHAACSVDSAAGVVPENPTGKPGLLDKRKTSVSFAELESTDMEILDAENYGHTPSLPASKYDEIRRSVKEICTLQNISESLKISLFPAPSVFHAFIQLYFEYFEKLFPIIHLPSFQPEKCHWVELLALATIGCRYSKSGGARRCVQALSEIFRLAVFHTIELDGLSVRSVWLTRVMVLDVIGTVYSGDKRLMDLGLTIVGGVVTQCRQNGYLEHSSLELNIDDIKSRGDLERAWELWCQEESCRRLVYGIWILQCQLALNFDVGSNMRMNELLKPLPCAEELWEAPNAEIWLSLFRNHAMALDPPGLCSALATVVQIQSVPIGIGGFGRLAMVHAIYQTTFDLRSFVTNPLIRDLTGPSLNAGLTMRTWQSRVFTCLEFLTPLEPVGAHEFALLQHNTSWLLQSNFITTIHHVKLLTVAPIGDIFFFVSPRSDPTDLARVRENLLDWVSHDGGQDARRAVLSASIIFTITRLRPSQSFHESIPFLMATLTIWIYNHLMAPLLNGTCEPSTERGHAPITLRLDQAVTSEGSRTWIESEAGTVRGYLADVGSLHDHSAGKRLLITGCQVLSSMQSWGPSRGFAKQLKTLLDMHYR